MSSKLSLRSYKLLGRSGLRVSPLALGTMTFGKEWGWGADHDEAHRIFDVYTENGGNFIDTSNQYTNGTAERLVGMFSAGRRDSLVIATKYTTPTRLGDPNSGGNHRKSMVNSVEMSLRNLQSDYIDLLYLHAWDSTTRVEEILRGLDDLVRSGKVLYVGISNTVAWQIARMQTIADLRGYSPLVALQIEYNLLERTVERDLIPMAREMGLGVIPWSPLACGILAGKYSEADLRTTRANESSSRRELLMETHRLSERALEIADVVKNVAAEVGRSPAQIALAWTLENPAVTSPIIGARTLRQLEDNLGALDVEFTESQYRYLSDASRIALGFPHDYLSWLLASSFMSSCMSITR